MSRALQLARQGAGHTSPNPMVGAVVVCDGMIVGEGFHRQCGQAHAEVNAIASVNDQSVLHESTIYVTLEPCSHYGKTPPCANLLIEKGVKRVVVGCLDPFEKVSGRGVEMLREAGINVTVGVLENECKALNERFFTAHTTKRPWVMLKWAQSRDGFMANEDGAVRFSTALTQRLMHSERSRVDAILVGARTVAVDNPSLTTRHWSGNSPLRVVIDGDLSLPSHSLLFNDGGKTLVYKQLSHTLVHQLIDTFLQLLRLHWVSILNILEHLRRETRQSLEMQLFSLRQCISNLKDAIIWQTHDISRISLVNRALPLCHKLRRT